MPPTLRRDYDPATLLATHPPVLRNPHKRLVFELCCPPGAVHAGSIVVSRWAPARLPATVELAATDLVSMPGYYDYAGGGVGVWHVNFADAHLFVAYGSALLAQDELQAAEHPVLGSIREALLDEGQPALTEDDTGPTPVLVAGVERRCTIDTAPDAAAGRPFGLYGNRFSAAPAEVVRAAVRVHPNPAHTNLIAIAAPSGGRGRYSPAQLDQVLTTAYTGFAAAAEESRRLWPGAAIEVRTGFWGCGAFGGNRHVMTLLQLLAARLAGVDRLRFYAFDDVGRADYRAGASDLDQVLAAGSANEPLAELMARVAQRNYEWGTSDGN